MSTCLCMSCTRISVTRSLRSWCTQGMYPTIAKKIASNGPYKSVADVYNEAGLTDQV